jgi:hypothetical protein
MEVTMQGKNLIAAALVLFGIFAGYLVFGQIQKYRALKSLTINAILECKENLNFLYSCESYMRESVSETDAMIQAQAGIQRTLKKRDISALLKAKISREKKQAVTRISDQIDSYNAALAYAFYGATASSLTYPKSAPGTGDMIKEILELEKILKKTVLDN